MIIGAILIDTKKKYLISTVDHEVILKKLECVEVVPVTLLWFKLCLSSRIQQCCVNGVMSGK